MALGYICFYYDYADSFDELTDDQIGRVVKAAVKYGKTGIRDRLPSSGERVALRFITSSIDRDQKAYDEKCKKAKSSVEKRYKKDADESDDVRPNTDVYETYQEKEKEKEKEKENTINSESTRARAREEKKPEKKKFGKYGNVMLTDEEAERLRAEHADFDDAVEFLSEYIAEDERRGKEYQRKDHAVALQRWVFEAVDERRRKRPNTDDGGGLNFDMEDIFEKPEMDDTREEANKS